MKETTSMLLFRGFSYAKHTEICEELLKLQTFFLLTNCIVLFSCMFSAECYEEMVSNGLADNFDAIEMISGSLAQNFSVG